MIHFASLYDSKIFTVQLQIKMSLDLLDLMQEGSDAGRIQLQELLQVRARLT